MSMVTSSFLQPSQLLPLTIYRSSFSYLTRSSFHIDTAHMYALSHVYCYNSKKKNTWKLVKVCPGKPGIISSCKEIYFCGYFLETLFFNSFSQNKRICPSQLTIVCKLYGISWVRSILAQHYTFFPLFCNHNILGQDFLTPLVEADEETSVF